MNILAFFKANVINSCLYLIGSMTTDSTNKRRTIDYK